MKKTIIFLGLAMILALGFSLSAEAKTKTSAKTAAVKTETVKPATLNVFYFHGKQRCPTCMAIESLTRSVLNDSYSKELKSGKITFKVIDISTEDGEKIADKYKVSWSSLILDKGGKRTDLTDMAFSYAKNQPDVFNKKLKAELNKRLK